MMWFFLNFYKDFFIFLSVAKKECAKPNPQPDFSVRVGYGFGPTRPNPHFLRVGSNPRRPLINTCELFTLRHRILTSSNKLGVLVALLY